MTFRLGALLTHPIQYHSPWLAKLAQRLDLKVYYAHRQTAAGQAEAGFGVEFDWDVPLLEGYQWKFLKNVAARPGIGRFSDCDTPEISGILQRERFDALLLFGWNKKTYLQAWQAALRCGTPVFVRLDNQLVGPQRRVRHFAKRVAYALALPWSADYLSPGRRTDAYLRHYGVPTWRIHRVPHMVDTVRFATAAEAARRDGSVAAMRARHGAGPDTTVFLFVGKFIAEKRTDLLIEAFAQLSNENEAQLWFVGSGPLASQLEEFSNSRSLDVHFLGFMNQTQLPTAYAAADCLVLCSERETWGLVVNEAIACGLPGIVSIQSGCAEDLIRDGETGWLLRELIPEQLAGLMKRACREVRAIRRAELVKQSALWSPEVGAQRLVHALESVRERRRRA